MREYPKGRRPLQSRPINSLKRAGELQAEADARYYAKHPELKPKVRTWAEMSEAERAEIRRATKPPGKE